MRRAARALGKLIEQGADIARNDIPAGNIRNQLPSASLPPAGNTGSGYTPGDDSVTTAKIEDGSVTPAKLSFDPATQAELDAHIIDTTSVHGITDTSALYRAGGTDVAVADGGNGVSAIPRFSAWLTSGSNQTIATATFTKIQANSEFADTNNNYDPTTNYRFTPTVAGTYLFIANGVYLATLVDQKLHGLYLYKNGSRSNTVENTIITSGTGDAPRILMVGMIAANGSTDYFELYTYHEKGSDAVLWAGAGNFSAIWIGP